MQEQVNNYLKELLTNIKSYSLTPDEEKKAQHDKAGFIIDKLMRKKVRRRISEETLKLTKQKVEEQVKNNLPICLVMPFGGYKHFWNTSHPEPDWAEVFHICWMIEYVLPILAIYKPGIILEYVSEDLILPRMNNYSEEVLDIYSSEFRKLLEWYSKYTPENLEFRYWRVSEKYNKQAIIDKVEALLPERKSAFAKLSLEQQEQEIHRSLRSVFWNGKKDLTNLTEEQKRERVIESRLIELAYYDVEASSEFVGEYFWQDNRICTCFSFGLSTDNDGFGDLTLQSALGSSVDYWIGRGILRYAGDKLYGTIISKQQYDVAKDTLEVIRITSGLVPLKNCATIEVQKSL